LPLNGAAFKDAFPHLPKPGDINHRISESIILSSRAPIGYVAVLKDDMACNQGCKALIAKNNKQIDPLYFYYLFLTKENELNNLGSGSTFKELSKTKLEEFEFTAHDIIGQIEISKIINKADKALQQCKAASALPDQFLQSTFLSMFGDPVNNEKEWELKKIGEVISSIRYGTGSPPEYSEVGIPFIRATNIKHGRIIGQGMVFISPDEAKKIEKCKVKKGDWIIVRSGANTGDAAVINEAYENAYAGYDLVVELDHETAIFYNHLINSDYGVKTLEPLTRRAGQPHLNSDQTKNLQFYFPPISLQQRFADIVKQTERLRQKQKESEQWLERLFQSLLQKYFG
jgi:type I restriction enzyme S subunit